MQVNCQSSGTSHRESMNTMREERARATFPVEALRTFVAGGKAYRDMLDSMLLLVERDQQLRIPHFFDRSREQGRVDSMRQIRRTAEIFPHLTEAERDAFVEAMSMYDRTFMMRLYVHLGLFRENIRTHGTATQWAEWRERIDRFEVIGCFAMTEMAHSSHLRGLETTATFDADRDAFVIHSPSVTATKVWIGAAGEIATHTVAVCQLVIHGRSLGLHWFMVPLRDPATGRTLPGVTCGDLGAKMGRNGLDNGWIQFTHVVIPRTNMLMKWSTVDASGKHTPSPSASLAYNTLISERLSLVRRLPDVVGQCAVIATRFGVVRRQGPGDPLILDYSTHQSQLMPLLSASIVLTAASRHLMGEWVQALSVQDRDPATFVASLKDWHGLAASLKAWLGWWGADALETCRRTMGGQGYSAYNAIAGHIADYGVMTTGGGDNIVMAQQASKYLLSALGRAMRGRPVGGYAAYLGDAPSLLAAGPPRPATPEGWCTLPVILEVLQWLSVAMLMRMAGVMEGAVREGVSPGEAWNTHQVSLIRASRPHAWLSILRVFVSAQGVREDALAGILSDVAVTFGLSVLEEGMADLLEHEGVTPEGATMIRTARLAMCRSVRPNAIGLSDAMGFPDYILKSPFARYDGDAYQRYLETWSLATDTHDAAPYWKDLVQPLVSAKI